MPSQDIYIWNYWANVVDCVDHSLFNRFMLEHEIDEVIVEHTPGIYFIFKYKDSVLFPYSGTALKYGLIEVQPYTVKDFLSVFSEWKIFLSVPAAEVKHAIFSGYILKRHISYTRLVSKLEEFGYAKTKASDYILANDERRFALTQQCCNLVPTAAEYVDVYYEVDSLGSIFTKDITSILLSINEKMDI